MKKIIITGSIGFVLSSIVYLIGVYFSGMEMIRCAQSVFVYSIGIVFVIMGTLSGAMLGLE